MMMITLRSVYLMVAVLHVLAFSTILCKIDVEREKRSDDDLIPDRGDFLIGENTPVWTVKNNLMEEPLYFDKTIGLVKQSINIWKRDNREVIIKNMSNWDIGRKSVDQLHMGEDVYHPSILIVMMYLKKKYTQSTLHELLTYTGAFWNDVDLQLRRIKNPSIRLRISGIVIVHPYHNLVDRAIPYVKRSIYTNDKKHTIRIQVNSMIKH